MKKICVLILSILIFLVMLPFAGCDYGKFPQKELRVSCWLDGDSFKLPVKFKGAFHMPTTMTFTSEQSIADFKEIIDEYEYKDCIITTQMNGNVLVIEKTNSDGTTHYYSLSLWGQQFWLSSPPHILDVNGGQILFPLHYLDSSEIADKEKGYGAPVLLEDTFYSTPYEAQDFVLFYSKLEECAVEQAENTIEVNIKDNKLLLTFHDGKVAYKSIY